MKFYQSKIFKIIMSIIAIIIIFKYSFLIFLAGIGLVVYLNKKNCKFKSFHKVGKILLSSFIVLFTLLLIGVKNTPTTNKSAIANSNVENSSETTKPSDNSEVKEDAKSKVTENANTEEPKQDTDVQQTQATTKDENTQSVNASASSNGSSSSNSNSVKSSNSTSTNSNNNTNSTTETNTNDENTIVYCVPNSDVYHLSKSDSTLKKSKNIYEITLKEAKAKGMHQSKSKADN